MNYAMRFWDLNFFLFSLFFLFLLNLFSVFSLLRSGDIGADTRSKSALVLTGQFAGRTYHIGSLLFNLKINLIFSVR